MRIAVLGAGAMGSWFGGQLKLAGHEVQLLTTNESHIEAVKNNGLTMQGRNKTQHVKIDICRPDEFQGPTELVITLTKTFQLDRAMQSIADNIGADTSVLSLQNGLGNLEVIANYVNAENIWLGVTMLPVDKIAAGEVANKGQGSTWFGPATVRPEEHQKNNQTIESAFTDAGIDFKHDHLIHKRIWEKVAFNAGMNAVCALCYATPGLINKSPESLKIVQQAASEVNAVATAMHIDIELDSVYRAIDYACKNHGDHKPSMLQDLLAGKRTEVCALNAAVVARAQDAGVEVPVNEMLCNLIKLSECGHRK